MKAHWTIAFALTVPGMALYRAISSGWITVESPYMRMGLQVLGVTLGVAGICYFLFNSQGRRRPKTEEEKRNEK